MKKRIFPVFAVLALTFLLAACSGGEDQSQSRQQPASRRVATPDTVAGRSG